jgi:hypothetical protein
MPQTQPHPESTLATRTVKTRRITFDHENLGPDRYYAGDNPFASHLISTFSAVIPKGEAFFAESVRHYRSQLDDPILRAQTSTFVGQEVLHQREHERFNETIGTLGYPTELIDRISTVTFLLCARLPHRLQLAMTAAIEHYTSIISEHVLSGEELDSFDFPDEARAFLGWHMIEELEHKAVAFDAMQAIGTSEVERIAAMALATAVLIPSVVGGMTISLAIDPGTYNPIKVARSVVWLRRSIFARRSFLRDLVSYERHGFHPDERDVNEVLNVWRDKLFGPQGELSARLGTVRAS